MPVFRAQKQGSRIKDFDKALFYSATPATFDLRPKGLTCCKSAQRNFDFDNGSFLIVEGNKGAEHSFRCHAAQAGGWEMQALGSGATQGSIYAFDFQNLQKSLQNGQAFL